MATMKLRHKTQFNAVFTAGSGATYNSDANGHIPNVVPTDYLSLLRQGCEHEQTDGRTTTGSYTTPELGLGSGE